MPLPLFVIALLAPAAGQPPITVTGHAWAPFISPMGEPFRARSVADDTLANWFRQADRDGDGALTAAEMVADAERFFATLDADRSAEIDPEEMTQYEWEIAPDVQVTARTRRAPGQAASSLDKKEAEELRPRDRRRLDEASLGLDGTPQGAARYGLLNMPQPVAAADTDFNRGVSLAEFRQAAMARFQLLDTAHTGRLTLAQLQAIRPEPPVAGKRPKKNERDRRIGNPLPPSN